MICSIEIIGRKCKNVFHFETAWVWPELTQGRSWRLISRIINHASQFKTILLLWSVTHSLKIAWTNLSNTAIACNLNSLKWENWFWLHLFPLVSLCTKISTHSHTQTHTQTVICFTLAHIKSVSQSQSDPWLMLISCQSGHRAQSKIKSKDVSRNSRQNTHQHSKPTFFSSPLLYCNAHWIRSTRHEAGISPGQINSTCRLRKWGKRKKLGVLIRSPNDPSPLPTHQEWVNRIITYLLIVYYASLFKNYSLLQLRDWPPDSSTLHPLATMRLWRILSSSLIRGRQTEKKQTNSKRECQIQESWCQRLLSPWGCNDSSTEGKQRWKEERLTESNRKRKSEGHRLWQQGSLLPLCPSMVGGTLMSTTLLPGESSCPDRSEICFWDTIR